VNSINEQPEFTSRFDDGNLIKPQHTLHAAVSSSKHFRRHSDLNASFAIKVGCSFIPLLISTKFRATVLEPIGLNVKKAFPYRSLSWGQSRELRIITDYANDVSLRDMRASMEANSPVNCMQELALMSSYFAYIRFGYKFRVFVDEPRLSQYVGSGVFQLSTHTQQHTHTHR
jgi:hypothetical protein